MSLIEDKLKVLANDEHMLNAIKSVLYDRIEQEKPDIEKTDNNQMVGENYRAYIQAKRIVDQVFKDIDSYKEVKVGQEINNKGK